MYISSYPFQQNNNLLYFTGFNEPDCCLVLTKDADDQCMTETFFVTPNDEASLLWSGPRAGIEGAKELFGLQNTLDIKKLEEFIEELAKKKNIQIYLDYHAENCSLSSEIYKKITVNHRTKALEPLTTKLRLVKRPEELELMKKSGEIAAESFREVRLEIIMNNFYCV